MWRADPKKLRWYAPFILLAAIGFLINALNQQTLVTWFLAISWLVLAGVSVVRSLRASR
jgi:hypothetical protein